MDLETTVSCPIRLSEPVSGRKFPMILCILTTLARRTHGQEMDAGQVRHYNIKPVIILDPGTGKASPFFPIGWYHFGPMTKKTLDEVHDNGANTAHFGGLGRHPWQKANTRAGLDHARKLSMKVLLTFASEMVAKVVYGTPERVGHILLYDDQRNEYFLIVTNNESSDQEVRLTITDSPVPLASLRVREPHANSLLQLNELGAGQYRLDDTLANHDVAIYVFDAKPL